MMPQNEQSIGDRIIDLIVEGKLVSHREHEPIVFVWAANAAEQITALVNDELQKRSYEDRSYTAMLESRERDDW